MSTRPIDIQNVLSKTQEVGRVQKVQDETPTLYQEAAAAEASRQSDKRREKVSPSPKGEGAGINRAGRRDARRGTRERSDKSPSAGEESRGQDDGANVKDAPEGKGLFIDVEA